LCSCAEVAAPQYADCAGDKGSSKKKFYQGTKNY
jgi:hypothetical protein